MAQCCDLEANEAMLCAYGLTPLMVNLYVYLPILQRIFFQCAALRTSYRNQDANIDTLPSPAASTLTSPSAIPIQAPSCRHGPVRTAWLVPTTLSRAGTVALLYRPQLWQGGVDGLAILIV